MPIDVLVEYYQHARVGFESVLLQILPFVRGFGVVLLVGSLCTIVVRIVGFLVQLREPSALLLLTPPLETNTSFTKTNELFQLLAGLMRYRPIIGRFFVPAARYSFEIVSTKEAGIQYLLRVPRRQVETVTKTLRGYLPGMQVRATSEYLKTHSTPAKVIPFYLKTHFAFPLKEHVELSAHDPIAYFTNSMTQLGAHELMALQIVVRPLSRLHDWALLHTVSTLRSQIARGDHVELGVTVVGSIVGPFLRAVGWLVTQLTWALTTVVHDATRTSGATPAVVAAPATLAANEEEHAAIKTKLEQPLFLASVRTFIQVGRSSLASREQGIGGSFETFMNTTGQGFRPAFDLFGAWRFRTRQLSGTAAVLSPSELAGLFHFPETKTSETEDLVRSRSRELAAPLSFKHATPNFDTVFATNTFGGRTTPIGLTLEERRRHTYIVGATGAGKTTLLATMIQSDIVSGKGVAVVDPHGQLIEQLLRTTPKERLNDVVWFAPDDDGFPIALNLLDLSSDKETTPSQHAKQKSLVASHLISVFQKFYDAKYFGPRMEYVLRNAILTALETPAPTLLTILDILTKKDYRKDVTRALPAGVLKDFWTYEFEKLGSLQRNQMISPITNKLGAILSSPLNYQILSQPKSKLDFSAVMDEGKILLCDLSKGKIGEDESNFFGSLVIAKLQLAALGRARIPEVERRDFFLYVDEFQNFATGAFAELVSEARKYRLATILAHQSISQISERDIIKVILANVGTTITFRTANPEDESFLLPIFAPEVGRYDIPNLPLYRAYMKVAVGEPRAAFMADVTNFTVEGSEETLQAVIEYSRDTYATPVEQSSPTPSPGDPRTQNPGQSGSEDQNPFPLSLTGTEYGRDWQKEGTMSATTKNTLTLTNQQHDILLHLLRFRFLDRSQLQQLLGLTDYKNLNKLFQQLTEHDYIGKITRTKTPTIYHLAPNGIRELKTHPKVNEQSLKKLSRESDRSDAFIQRCLLIASLNLDLRVRVAKTIKYGMFVPSDYPALPLATELTELEPHAFVIREKAKQIDQLFIEILSDLPTKHLRTQLKRYITAFDEQTWQAATNMPFPALLLIAPTPDVQKTAQRLMKQLMDDLGDSRPTIRFTTSDKAIQPGITVDMWD